MSEAGVFMPELEADRIICHVTGLPRASLLAHPELELSGRDLRRIARLGGRRASGEPLAYVLEDAIFCGRSYFVDKRVLVPRPETEILAGLAGEFLKRNPKGVFADWCTGSGCIAVTLLAENSECRAYAVDSSGDALAVAKRNAAMYAVGGRVTFVMCANPLDQRFIEPGSLDLVVANPPYIPSGALEALEPQVREHEPVAALDGGADGLDVFRALLRGVPRLMRHGAPLLVETGGGSQIEAIIDAAASLAPELSFENVFCDHREIVRFMLWHKLA
jgi:release factor glutamine methyltransferase